jgi:4-amino-4-deoxy-L-arabinose transferase-like glycosyltransferase
MLKKMNRKNLITFIRSNIGIIAIVFLGAFLRFFPFPYVYGFDPDATRDAIIAYEGARHWYFPLVGAFSSTGPYTFGPWYYISIIIAEFLFPTIYSPWILMGLASLITIIIMYDIGRITISKRFGLLLALLVAVAPSEITVGTSLGNISPVALFATLTLWTSIRILSIKNAHVYWYFLLGLFLGFAINAHFQSFGLLFLPVLVWLGVKKKSYRTILLCATGFLLTFIPLIIFNLTHNWHTLRGIQEMYIAKERIYVANSWKLYLFQFWPSLVTYIFGTPQIISLALLILVPVLFCFQLIRRKISRTAFLPLLILIINGLALRYYWGERSWAYHYFLEPFIIFFVGYSLYQLTTFKRYGIGIVLFFILTATIIGGMGKIDIQRIIEKTQITDGTLENIHKLTQKFPNRNIVIYHCTEDRSAIAEAATYLLKFENNSPNGLTQKIGIESGSCPYPISVSHDTKKILIEHTLYSDFSLALEEELKSASWSATSTEAVYKKSARWY